VTVYTGFEQRSGQDRRHQNSLFKKLFSRKLRESTRRAEDRNGIIVFDRYKPSLVISIIIVLILSLLDALLTLILLSQGAKELNPVMQFYINYGAREFIYAKYGLTAVPMLIVLFAKEALVSRYRIDIGVLFHIFGAFFGLVIAWELYLLSIG